MSASTGEQPECGWVLVPREPTDKMMNAVAADYFSRVLPENRYPVISDCWRAMIAAAPAPPTDTGGLSSTETEEER